MIFSLFLVADATRVTKHSFLGTEESALKESYPAPGKPENQPVTEDEEFLAKIAQWTEEKQGEVYDKNRNKRDGVIGWPYYDLHERATDKFQGTDEYKELEAFGVYYSSTQDAITEAEKKIQKKGRFGAVPEAYSHRRYIQKVYDDCPHLFPSVTQEQLDVHDLSKFEFIEAVGYTCNWSRGETCFLPKGDKYRDLAKERRSKEGKSHSGYGYDYYEDLAKERRSKEGKSDSDYGYDYYEAALEHHYQQNKHHPEHYSQGEVMEETHQEEMVIDVIASIWERLGKEHQTVYAFLTQPMKSGQFPFWRKPGFFSTKNVEENKDFVNKLVERLITEKCGAQQG